MKNRVDVIIAMDLSYNPEDDQILRLRQHPIHLDELSPVIRLVTINSAEHVRLCLPSRDEIPSDRSILHALVYATTLLRNFNGVIQSTDRLRHDQVAEYIRSKGGKGSEVFGIRDIEGYMAGHRGLAGEALKRARSPQDDESGDRKRQRTGKPLWQVFPLPITLTLEPSSLFLQQENDELRETLAKKQQLNETLRADLAALQTKFDTLNIQKTDLEARLEQTVADNTALRQQISSAPHSDPVFLQGEINRLVKALENKTKDFDYLTSRYQDASSTASESVLEVSQLKEEVEKLKRRLEIDIKAVTWASEKKVLMEKIQELEARCSLLEERERTRA
jgi:predicted  nucleic acid-binding Zn-ribbon protein